MSGITYAVSAGQPQWYVLMVRCNHEKRIAQQLKEKGIDHLLPCYRSIRQWKDRRVTLEMPLFPSYVFVRILLDERLRALAIPHVFSFVGTAGSPSAVPEQEIDALRRGTEHGKSEPYPYLTAGDRVVVTEGALCGVTGILLRQQGSARLVVSVESIARSFVLEVDSSYVQPLSGSGADRWNGLADGALVSAEASRPPIVPGRLPA
jgi:transcription antitermination factor NusG